MAYQCNYHDSPAEAVTLVTSLTNGTTLAACAQCEPLMFVGVIAAYLDVPPGDLYAAIERYAKRASRQAAQAADAGVPAGTERQYADCPACGIRIEATAAEMAAAQAEHAAQCAGAPAAAPAGDQA